MHGRISTTITYTASGAAIIGGITLSDWGVVIGLLVAIISLAYNIWHKKELRRIARSKKIVNLGED